jgi:hypothetical protein
VTENRILRNQITGRVRLTDGERKALAEIGQKLGKKALEAVANIVKPDTIIAWYRQLVAQKFDGSNQRKAPGRPTTDQELEGNYGNGKGSAALDSLEESGDLEYAADVVLFLTEAQERMATPPARAVALTVAKNRHGDTGKVGLIFRPDLGTMREEAKP